VIEKKQALSAIGDLMGTVCPSSQGALAAQSRALVPPATLSFRFVSPKHQFQPLYPATALLAMALFKSSVLFSFLPD
jgi:hypothetical protein